VRRYRFNSTKHDAKHQFQSIQWWTIVYVLGIQRSDEGACEVFSFLLEERFRGCCRWSADTTWTCRCLSWYLLRSTTAGTVQSPVNSQPLIQCGGVEGGLGQLPTFDGVATCILSMSESAHHGLVPTLHLVAAHAYLGIEEREHKSFSTRLRQSASKEN